MKNLRDQLAANKIRERDQNIREPQMESTIPKGLRIPPNPVTDRNHGDFLAKARIKERIPTVEPFTIPRNTPFLRPDTLDPTSTTPLQDYKTHYYRTMNGPRRPPGAPPMDQMPGGRLPPPLFAESIYHSKSPISSISSKHKLIDDAYLLTKGKIDDFYRGARPWRPPGQTPDDFRLRNMADRQAHLNDMINEDIHDTYILLARVRQNLEMGGKKARELMDEADPADQGKALLGPDLRRFWSKQADGRYGDLHNDIIGAQERRELDRERQYSMADFFDFYKGKPPNRIRGGTGENFEEFFLGDADDYRHFLFKGIERADPHSGVLPKDYLMAARLHGEWVRQQDFQEAKIHKFIKKSKKVTEEDEDGEEGQERLVVGFRENGGSDDSRDGGGGPHNDFDSDDDDEDNEDNDSSLDRQSAKGNRFQAGSRGGGEDTPSQSSRSSMDGGFPEGGGAGGQNVHQRGENGYNQQNDGGYQGRGGRNGGRGASGGGDIQVPTQAYYNGALDSEFDSSFEGGSIVSESPSRRMDPEIRDSESVDGTPAQVAFGVFDDHSTDSERQSMITETYQDAQNETPSQFSQNTQKSGKSGPRHQNQFQAPLKDGDDRQDFKMLQFQDPNSANAANQHPAFPGQTNRFKGPGEVGGGHNQAANSQNSDYLDAENARYLGDSSAADSDFPGHSGKYRQPGDDSFDQRFFGGGQGRDPASRSTNPFTKYSSRSKNPFGKLDGFEDQRDYPGTNRVYPKITESDSGDDYNSMQAADPKNPKTAHKYTESSYVSSQPPDGYNDVRKQTESSYMSSSPYEDSSEVQKLINEQETQKCFRFNKTKNRRRRSRSRRESTSTDSSAIPVNSENARNPKMGILNVQFLRHNIQPSEASELDEAEREGDVAGPRTSLNHQGVNRFKGSESDRESRQSEPRRRAGPSLPVVQAMRFKQKKKTVPALRIGPRGPGGPRKPPMAPLGQPVKFKPPSFGIDSNSVQSSSLESQKDSISRQIQEAGFQEFLGLRAGSKESEDHLETSEDALTGRKRRGDELNAQKPEKLRKSNFSKSENSGNFSEAIRPKIGRIEVTEHSVDSDDDDSLDSDEERHRKVQNEKRLRTKIYDLLEDIDANYSDSESQEAQKGQKKAQNYPSKALKLNLKNPEKKEELKEKINKLVVDVCPFTQKTDSGVLDEDDIEDQLNTLKLTSFKFQEAGEDRGSSLVAELREKNRKAASRHVNMDEFFEKSRPEISLDIGDSGPKNELDMVYGGGNGAGSAPGGPEYGDIGEKKGEMGDFYNITYLSLPENKEKKLEILELERQRDLLVRHLREQGVPIDPQILAKSHRSWSTESGDLAKNPNKNTESDPYNGQLMSKEAPMVAQNHPNHPKIGQNGGFGGVPQDLDYTTLSDQRDSEELHRELKQQISDARAKSELYCSDSKGKYLELINRTNRMLEPEMEPDRAEDLPLAAPVSRQSSNQSQSIKNQIFAKKKFEAFSEAQPRKFNSVNKELNSVFNSELDFNPKRAENDFLGPIKKLTNMIIQSSSESDSTPSSSLESSETTTESERSSYKFDFGAIDLGRVDPLKHLDSDFKKVYDLVGSGRNSQSSAEASGGEESSQIDDFLHSRNLPENEFSGRFRQKIGPLEADLYPAIDSDSTRRLDDNLTNFYLSEVKTAKKDESVLEPSLNQIQEVEEALRPPPIQSRFARNARKPRNSRNYIINKEGEIEESGRPQPAQAQDIIPAGPDQGNWDSEISKIQEEGPKSQNLNSRFSRPTDYSKMLCYSISDNNLVNDDTLNQSSLIFVQDSPQTSNFEFGDKPETVMEVTESPKISDSQALQKSDQEVSRSLEISSLRNNLILERDMRQEGLIDGSRVSELSGQHLGASRILGDGILGSEQPSFDQSGGMGSETSHEHSNLLEEMKMAIDGATPYSSQFRGVGGPGQSHSHDNFNFSLDVSLESNTARD